MSWLDSFFNAGYATILVAGVALPQQRVLNIVAGATGTNNPALNRTDLTLIGGAPSGTAGGDLGGTYPDPTVVNLTGAGGELGATPNVSLWNPSNNTFAASRSYLLEVTTTDDGPEVALTLAAPLNGHARWDCVVTATKEGNPSTGVGSLCTSWAASGAFTQRSGAAVLVFSDVGDPKGDSSGFTGPSFSPSATNSLLILDPGGATTGTVKWSVNVTISGWRV